MYKVMLSKRAIKDIDLLRAAGLAKKAKQLVDILGVNPFQNPPSYEKLIADFAGFYSRRINIKHRLVYRVDEKNHVVYVDSMSSHCEREKMRKEYDFSKAKKNPYARMLKK